MNEVEQKMEELKKIEKVLELGIEFQKNNEELIVRPNFSTAPSVVIYVDKKSKMTLPIFSFGYDHDKFYVSSFRRYVFDEFEEVKIKRLMELALTLKNVEIIGYGVKEEEKKEKEEIDKIINDTIDLMEKIYNE